MQHPMANYVASKSSSKHWLLDSDASHHITIDLNNLAIHSEYDGPNEVIIGDGSILKITLVGSTTLNTQKSSFILANTLCVPSLSKNLISIS